MAETLEQQRDRLLKRLDDRVAPIGALHRYYDGDHALPPLPEKANDDVKRLREACTLNLCQLVVDAVIERLAVQGFQFGTEGADGTDVWREVWQANRLDADSDLVHVEALIARRAFVLVWPTDDGGVSITPESPAEVLVDYDPDNRRRRVAAIKRFVTKDGTRESSDVTLWLPGEVHRWRRPSKGSTWELLEDESGGAPAELGGEIPVVEFLASPDLRGNPHSELDRGVIDVQDRINKTVFDRLVMTEFQAFPQRWAVGIEVEVDEAGRPKQPFEIGPDKIAVNEDPGVKFGQWDAAELKPLLEAIESDIHAMAAMTKTPVYYLAQAFSNVSADAIRAAEAGLVKKVERHQRHFGEAWEEVIRLALRLRGDARAADVASTVEWANPETRTAAEDADQAVKMLSVLPRSEVWRRLGYSPQDRGRFEADMFADQLTAEVAADGSPAVA